MPSLKNKTIFITGATRGIGREIALRCARDGANIIVTGKTIKIHPKLPGTIHSVAAEVVATGGRALAIPLDVRDDVAIAQAVAQAVAEFGGIDVLINNASAIHLTNTQDLSMKHFDLMWAVNARATFACSQACIPHLKKAAQHNVAHILTLSPPLNFSAKWFQDHTAYTLSKYGMSICTIGLAAELAAEAKAKNIAVNSLWPRTLIATSAIAVNFPKEILAACRKPTIVADAAYEILTRSPLNKTASGNFYIDEDVLRDVGVRDFSIYSPVPGAELITDLFLD
jgi:citronellol/citronellal dehydrogenase